MVLRIGLAVGVLLLGGLLWRGWALSAELARPVSMREAGYVGSASCRKCHGEHYASWHRTFHRTMTREASEQSVLGDFSGQSLSYMGVTAQMERGAQGEFRMRFESGEESFTAQVARTVGSHRYQQYLAREDDLFVRLPVAWDVRDGRFIHMNGAFLTPDPVRDSPNKPIAPAEYQRHVVRWNDNCIFCHNVAPNPGADGAGHFSSTVAELGVACEACHGPGGRHVRENRDPLRRYMQHLGLGAAPDIAAPERMGSARSSEVCGRCHGQRITTDIDDVHRHGDRFIPGEPLSEYSKPLYRDTTLGGEEGVFAARFWSDGTPRLTAYEYQGFMQSPCAKDERFSCGSCHSMHDSDPSGQVRADLLAGTRDEGAIRDNALCTQCHAEYVDAGRLREHTAHDVEGLGSRCVACHMPNVVHGLVGAHRSHRITTPKSRQHGGAPDACGLCHVDWNGARLAAQRKRLFGSTEAADVEDNLTIQELLLAGDPVERSVAAAALGSAGAAAAGSDVARSLALLLDTLRVDAYPGVRDIARRSLLSLLGSAPSMTKARLALRGLRATDEPAERDLVALRVRRVLPPEMRLELDPSWVSQLRARAQSVAIAIGE